MVLAPSPRRRIPGGGLLASVEAGPRPKWWIEGLVIVWLCWVYDALSNLIPLRNTAARHHAERILHLEQALHLDPEAILNHWLAGHPALGLWSGNYYDNAHFVVTLGVVGWLWWRYPRSYRPLRNGLVACNLIAFFVFWVYPTAPPRMLPGGQFVDVVSVTGAFGSAHGGTLATVADELAAMPSLHIAWAVWSSWAVFVVWRGRFGNRWWSWPVWLYPAATGVIVLGTGNHFLADVVAGVLTGVVAIWLGALVAQRWVAWRLVRSARAAVGAAPPGHEMAVDGGQPSTVSHRSPPPTTGPLP